MSGEENRVPVQGLKIVAAAVLAPGILATPVTATETPSAEINGSHEQRHAGIFTAYTATKGLSGRE